MRAASLLFALPVVRRQGGGTSGGADCSTGGWDCDDVAMLSRILLWPSSRSMFNGAAGRVDLELGCQTSIS